MVTLAEPAMLWLVLAPAAAALVAVARHRRRVQQQRRLASPGVWDRLMGGTPSTGLSRLLLWCVAAALVALALARPQWGELPGEESVRTRDLVVALDVSDSMLCPDLKPFRLARSLEVIERALPGFEGNRVGVVVFAGDAYPLVPLTTDLNAVAAFLDGVGPGMVALPGSNLERAAEVSLRLFPPEGEGRVVVFVTDGENLQGDMETAAEALREAGVGVLAVVAGTESGGPIPVPSEDGSVHYKRDASGQPVVTRARPDVLREIAAAVDGDVLELTGGQVVAGLIEAVDRLRTREIEATRTVRKVERFPIFLVAAAVALVLGFALSPWRRMAVATGALLIGLSPTASLAQQGNQPPPAVPTPTASSAQAAESASASENEQTLNVSWWQRWIPGGSRRLSRAGLKRWHDQDLQGAAEGFAGAAILDPENPDRLYDLGTTLAAGGQLEAATPMLVKAHEEGVAAAAYNGGTASLQQQQAEMAVQWLRQAVLANPDDPDAKRNYELALKLLEQQQQQDQEKQQDQQEQQERQPTPSPTPSPQQGEPPPTPTPDQANPVLSALDRAEAEARQQMRSPTPVSSSVEKDW